MKNNKHYQSLLTGLMLIIIGISFGCKKDFLDAKPSTSIISPTSLSDFQQLIDNGNVNRSSSLPQLSCDDYYLINEAAWQASTPTERNAYLWSKDLFGGEVARSDWNSPYLSVFYANSVLNGLGSVTVNATNVNEYNDIKGQAYFIRAFAFFDLAKNFAPPYDQATETTDLGIPLRLSPNVNEIIQRSSVQQTYQQIINDLSSACQLLKGDVPVVSRNRASKPAAYALFARLYLSMRNYQKAEVYADSCLILYNQLINYNTVSKTSTTPFPKTNNENIFWAFAAVGYNNSLYNAPANLNVDTALLASYAPNDLRRNLYFITANGLTKEKRGYSGYGSPFTGLATDEIYLIKAECAARRQDVNSAMTYLNALLVNRFAKNTYVPYTAGTPNLILNTILQERRKELVWRDGLRWDDLRRLNKEGANITLKRILNGVTYSIPPNSPLYVFPIPDDEIILSGIKQNAR
ncbi:MAG: RagB/SusD family nutrient uptake outer membrane protein [Mucilaginibacter sp.]|uniref:RagB/SusD family nutrient uptake outer membrane protein n=1 Tax=Mucilaginibacter sp. TaxID=1882438 RepID=UPI0032637367